MSKNRDLSNTLNGGQTIDNDGDITGLTVKGNGGQTANLIELKDENNNHLNSFDKDGVLERFDTKVDWGDSFQELEGEGFLALGGDITIDISKGHVVKIDLIEEITSVTIDNPRGLESTHCRIHLKTDGSPINWTPAVETWVGQKPWDLYSGNYLITLKLIDGKWIGYFNGVSFLSELPFRMTVRMEFGQRFHLPFRYDGTGVYDCTVDWGDGRGVSEIVGSPESAEDSDFEHLYYGSGDYTISISGTMSAIFFDSGVSADTLLSIDDWGNTGLTNLEKAFSGCTNLNRVNRGSVSRGDTTEVTDMTSAFYQCSSLITFPFINVNNVMYFSDAFRECTSLTNFPVGIFDGTSSLDFRQTFYICNLTEESVDNIIVSVNAASTNNILVKGILDINAGTSEAPGQDGLDAQQILEDREWTVFTN
jgi:hypothetical protein